ncbi:MAG: VTT domain-containing protein [Anaerolineae bacterium]
MDTLNIFLDAYGVAAIFVVLLAKSIGIPIPIPADAIMLLMSARAAEGRLSLAPAFIASLIALVVGGVIQFAAVRGPGRNLLYRFGRYMGLTPARLDAASKRVPTNSPLGIGLAVLTPGVRSVVVIGCGLAGVTLSTFAVGLALGSAAFLALHFFLGFAGRSLLLALGISAPAALGILVAVLILGLVTWVVIRRRRQPNAPTQQIVAQAIGAWHEATCPVCLALNAISPVEGAVIASQHDHSH